MVYTCRPPIEVPWPPARGHRRHERASYICVDTGCRRRVAGARGIPLGGRGRRSQRSGSAGGRSRLSRSRAARSLHTPKRHVSAELPPVTGRTRRREPRRETCASGARRRWRFDAGPAPPRRRRPPTPAARGRRFGSRARQGPPARYARRPPAGRSPSASRPNRITLVGPAHLLLGRQLGGDAVFRPRHGLKRRRATTRATWAARPQAVTMTRSNDSVRGLSKNKGIATTAKRWAGRRSSASNQPLMADRTRGWTMALRSARAVRRRRRRSAPSRRPVDAPLGVDHLGPEAGRARPATPAPPGAIVVVGPSVRVGGRHPGGREPLEHVDSCDRSRCLRSAPPASSALLGRRDPLLDEGVPFVALRDTATGTRCCGSGTACTRGGPG